MTTNDKEANWRQRYLKQGDELDANQARYREHIELLQRLVSRLSLTVDDSNADFHREIKQLRQKLKGELTSLPALSESLAHIDHLLLAQQEGESAIRITLPEDTGTITKKPSLWKRVAEPLKQVWQSKSNADAASNNDGGANSDDLHQEARIEVVPEDFIELPGAEKLKEVLESTPGYGAIASKVADTLNGLLSQLSYPESAQADLQALRLRIAGRVNWYELPPTLEDLSRLIISSVGKGQRQFDSFLQELDEQLASLQSFLLEHHARDQTWIELSQQFQEAISEQNTALTDRVSSSADSEQLEAELKDSIREHIEQIANTTLKYVKQGEQLSEGFQPQLTLMRERIESMTAEQEALRKRLKDERHKALLDVLTQLPNREAYDERLEFEFDRWQRYKEPVVLVLADIDHFEQINERYGHLSGDRTLQIIAKEMRHRIRKTDFISRYTGEQFGFILPQTKLDIAEQVVDKLRQTVSQLPFHFRAQRVQLTLSFGVVAFDDCSEFLTLTERANEALARAKADGRNCVRLWSKDLNN